MKKAAIPFNEKERLQALYSYDILDSASEEIFDSITKLAGHIYNVPVCLISLVDGERQWFKAKKGLSACETSRDISFCGHAILGSEVFYVADSTKDERFSDNPLVTQDPHVVFYAGVPLIDRNGFALGTLCLIDHQPREFQPEEFEQLKVLGMQVTHLIEARKEKKEREKTLSLLTKLSLNLPGFIYTYKIRPDGTSCFPYSSTAIKDIYEVSPEDVVNDASIVFTRIHPDDLQRVAQTIQASAENMTLWSCDYRVVLPSLGEKWLRGTANPERDSENCILWHGYISDITEMKQHELVFQQAMKMASLGEMASGIAHEINNPLTIIKTAAQQSLIRLKSEKMDQKKVILQLELINKTSDRISKIIRGLRFFAYQSKSKEFKTESLGAIIEDTVSLCREKFKVNQIHFTLQLPDNVDALFIDCRAVEISQVLLNLLNNAFDAIEFKETKWVRLTVEESAESVKLSVVDSGGGIPPELVAKILTPFYTTKAAGKGTGLGLSIIQGIVESHSGKIWIDTNCKDTKFVVELPKTQQVKTQAA